jgi:hypothetical protein
LRESVEPLLKLAVVFSAVVAMMDFFFADFPILLSLGLTVTFIFFAVLIFDQITHLVSKVPPSRPEAFERYDDDITWLEHLVDRAIQQREPKSVESLATRLRTIVLALEAYRTGISEARLEEMAKENPQSLLELIREEDMTQILAGNASRIIGKDLRGIEALLTKIEGLSM